MMNDTKTPPSTPPETVPKERIDVINEYLQGRVSSRPLIGVVCGSGLGGLSKCLSNQQVIKYEDIPQFPRSTVEGHAGELVFGDLNGISVICMRGRVHCYEGYSMQEITLPIRAMYLLGIKYLLVTNAAGGLNPDFNVGDLMILNDHLNMPGLSGQHPLIGPNDTRFGGRFTPLTNCYDEKLQVWPSKSQRKLVSHTRPDVACTASFPGLRTKLQRKPASYASSAAMLSA